MPISAWVLRLAGWLPVCFVAWWFLASAMDVLVGELSRFALNALAGGFVTQTETGSGGITFVTRVASGAGYLTVDVEPRLFSYGLPLGAAILLAALPRGLWWKLLVLVVAVLPIVVWGATFDVLAHLMRSAPAWSAATLGPAGMNLVALAYQLGSLIFPAMVPVAVAVALSWKRIGIERRSP